MPTLRDDAICIRHWDWSETSQTVSLFTREHGVLRGIAKGSKREKAPFSGGLEILTRGEVLAITKPGAGLATLTAWDLTQTYPACREDLTRHHAGLYAIDLIHHALPESDPHPALFDLLGESLGSIGTILPGVFPDAVILRFQAGLLREMGHEPQLEPGGLPESDTLGFDPETGSLTRDPGPGASGVWRIRRRTLGVLRRPASEADPADLDRANRFLAACLTHQLGSPPHTQQAALDAITRTLRTSQSG
ncbi:MAG: DNA repair protein RecO [Phycisphaerales bacterium JB040]